MKLAMNVFLIILATITFASCEKTKNPVAPDSSVDKTAQSYTGGFKVTYKDYQNTSRSLTLTGSIILILTREPTHTAVYYLLPMPA